MSKLSLKTIQTELHEAIQHWANYDYTELSEEQVEDYLAEFEKAILCLMDKRALYEHSVVPTRTVYGAEWTTPEKTPAPSKNIYVLFLEDVQKRVDDIRGKK